MMPYLLLVGSGVCLTVMSLLRKEYDKRTTGNKMASFTFIAFTYLAILIIALAYFLVTRTFHEFAEIDGFTVLLGVGFALATFITTVICIVGTSYGSVSLLVVFANLGTVTLSCLYGLIFDSERNDAVLFTWIGLALVLGIMFLNFMTEEKGQNISERASKKKWVYQILCFVVFFTNGIALVIYSMLTKHRPLVGSWHFISLYSLICVALAAFFIAFHLLFGRNKREDMSVKLLPGRVCFALIGAYAVFFLLAELMAIINTTQLPIIVQAPLSFAIPMIILTISECLIYKMRVTKGMLLKMGLALCSSVLFVL